MKKLTLNILSIIKCGYDIFKIPFSIKDFAVFPNVTQNDLLLARKWNTFLTLEFKVYSVAHITFAVEIFVQKYSSWLISNNLQSNYLNLLLALWKTGCIEDQKIISKNMANLYANKA